MNEKLIRVIEKNIKEQEQIIIEKSQLCQIFESSLSKYEDIKNFPLENCSSKIKKEYIDELKDYQYLLSLKFVKISEEQKNNLIQLLNKILKDLSLKEEKKKYDELIAIKEKVSQMNENTSFNSEEIELIKTYFESFTSEEDINGSLYEIVTNSLKNTYYKEKKF